ncbi:MAG: amidohydrolase family protein, partial [Candidatus Puniceispirillum sp.]|nr:amidohydrolase family protein [Candidatus Puniceispirillum sp.]
MTSPNSKLAAPQTPPSSCDCHVHVIGPTEQFPFSDDRAYTPMEANVEMLCNMAKNTSMERHVLVQPSIYGTDNRCLLAALETLGEKRARGVVVVSEAIELAEIDHLQRCGVRGLRLNLKSNGTPNYRAIEVAIANAARIAERYNWHIQLFMPS